jgi:hypothetical protein
MQSAITLTPTPYPSDGEREKSAASYECSLNSELAASVAMCSFAPSDGERVRVRGNFDCMPTAKLRHGSLVKHTLRTEAEHLTIPPHA